MFRRKTGTADPSSDTPEPVVEEVLPRAHTPGKGRPTPKRSAASRRRTAEPVPKDPKEARARMRAKQRQERAEAFQGMKSGDDKYLTPRDKGPVRRLVRDLVDARRNVGTYFFVGALVVVVGSMQVWPPPVRFGANLLWLALLFAMLFDGFLISRLVRRRVRERFPDDKTRMPSLFFYAVVRSILFRRLRNPKPRVEIGAAV